MLLTCLVSACASGPTEEEIDRSMRELRLAATLREEGSLPAAVEHLRKALELDPKNARAHVLMGYIHMQRRNLSKAEGYLRDGIELLEGRTASGEGAALAEARNVLGLTLIHQQRPGEAIPLLKSSASDVLNRAPHLAWGNLGLAYLKKKEYDRALEALQQAVQIQPRFCVGYYLMGKTHVARQELKKAEKALNHAIEADSKCKKNYQKAWRLRGETRARLGKHEDAIADLERCIELNPKSEVGKACQRLLDATE
jgi:tetratricopeptide (TPR) repeat protein